MDDPLLVCRLECRSDLCRDGHSLRERHRSTRDVRGQVLALDKLHHQGADMTRLLESVNDRDVRVVQ